MTTGTLWRSASTTSMPFFSVPRCTLGKLRSGKLATCGTPLLRSTPEAVVENLSVAAPGMSAGRLPAGRLTIGASFGSPLAGTTVRVKSPLLSQRFAAACTSAALADWYHSTSRFQPSALPRYSRLSASRLALPPTRSRLRTLAAYAVAL